MVADIRSCLIDELNRGEENVFVAASFKYIVEAGGFQLVQIMKSHILGIVVDEVQLVLLQHEFRHFQF